MRHRLSARRSLLRPLDTRLGRRLTRRIVGCSRPRYLAETIRCYKRALKARRRLMKLAPRLFDPAVVKHEHRQHELDLPWRSSSEAALKKVYGESEEIWPDPWWESRTQIAPSLLPELTIELGKWNLFRDRAEEMRRLHLQLQPHDVPSLGQICDLLKIASAFGRIAVGLETAQTKPLPPLNDHSQFEADLKRAYGQA